MDFPNITSISFLENLLKTGLTAEKDEALKTFGLQAIWIAALNNEIEVRLKRPRLHGYPPKIFISYRWADDEQKTWVKKLGLHLKNQGFEILLDQLEVPGPTSEDVREHGLSVPEFVGKIADCKYIFIVITPRYCDVVNPKTESGEKNPNGWVFDEYQMALRLRKECLAQIIGILKEGEQIPDGCDLLIDLRNVLDPLSCFDKTFGSYHGLVLSQKEQEELTLLIQKINDLINDRKFADASYTLELHRKYRDTIEYKALFARIGVGVGVPEEAIKYARSVLGEQYLNTDTVLEMANVLYLCGMKNKALKHLVPLSKTKVTFREDSLCNGKYS